MPRGLIYAPVARRDLEVTRVWLTQPGAGRVARRKLMAIWAAIEKLRDDPCLYPVGPHSGVTELPSEGGYRALYEVMPDTGRSETVGDIRVLRVFGPGQDRSAR